VTLKIYNLLGQEVRTIINETQEAGYKSIEWDASGYASGVYFYRIEATSGGRSAQMFSQVNKMVLVR